MKVAFDKPWEEWHPEDDHESDFVAPTSSGTFERRYYGPMDMDIAGDRVLIYDMKICSPLGPGNPQLFETVITLKPPSLDLPQFTLRPKDILGLLLTGNNRFKTETALDTLFEVETMTPHRVRTLFQSELGANVLIPFLNEQKWTIEWTGDRLIVYELNQLIVPDRIADVALEVSEFFDLLKSGPQAVDTVMQELFQTTSTRPLNASHRSNCVETVFNSSNCKLDEAFLNHALSST